MKKILALICAVTLIFVLVSCTDDKSAASKGDTSSKSTQSGNASSVSTQSEDVSSIPNEDDSSAPAQSVGKEITFTIINATEFNYKSISISEDGKNDWSENLLTETLASYKRSTVKINVPEITTDVSFNLLATDENGETTTFMYLNLSEATEEGGFIDLSINEGGGASAYFMEPDAE